MNKYTVSVVSVVLFILCSCTQHGVELRLENQSTLDFDQISVNNVSFGSLGSMEVSDYMPFENIYDQEFIQINIDGRIIKLVPEDFNEEEYRNSGRYKYVIDLLGLNEISVERLTE